MLCTRKFTSHVRRISPGFRLSTISPLRVLVVDDSEDAALMMALLLKRDGHEATVAHCGESALQQAPVFQPDVMFIDLSMPQIDGFSLARQLRQTTAFAATPLVAVTGHVDNEHRTLATAAGFSEYLTKPYRIEVLQAIVERVADRIRASRAMAQVLRTTAEQARRLNEQSRRGLNDYWRARRSTVQIPVTIERSGIANILTVAERLAADELRRWLKEQRCRVGPVFEQEPGRLSFFVYSRRHCIGELIAKNGRFSGVPAGHARIG